MKANVILTLISVVFAKDYVYTSSIDLKEISYIIKRPEIEGAQVVYNWKSLETSKDNYNFTKIEQDLKYVKSFNKKLIIQSQDRFFSPKARNIPDYLLNDPIYQDGLAPQSDTGGDTNSTGWVTKQWVPEVQKRYQKLLEALAIKFDGKIKGIILPETSIEVKEPSFNCTTYFDAELANALYAKKVFSKSSVIQYINFWPCEWNNDKGYMQKFFSTAISNGIGLGGPDVLPYAKAQMNNSYQFFNKYKNEISLIAMAIQEPDLKYINPKTNSTTTKQEFNDFATNYLGANTLFWTKEIFKQANTLK